MVIDMVSGLLDLYNIFLHSSTATTLLPWLKHTHSMHKPSTHMLQFQVSCSLSGTASLLYMNVKGIKVLCGNHCHTASLLEKF